MKYIILLLLVAGCIRTDNAGDYDAYGGVKAIQAKSTGFFRVDSTAGRWRFITPDGHGYFAIGANHTGKFLEDSSQSGPYLARFGGDSARARQDLLQNYLRLGYNAGEAYAELDPYLKSRLPYIAHLEYPQREYLQIDIFDPKEQTRLFEHTLAQSEPLRNDKMLIGIAFRDLPNWDRRRMDILRSWPATAPGKQEYVAFLRERHGGDITRLNKTYGSTFASFDSLAETEDWKLPLENEDIDRDDADFMAKIAELWYGTLARATRQGAPDHLFMGERHQLRDTPDAVLRVVGRHVDVFLTQALIRSRQRPPEWQVFQEAAYRHEYRLTRKPMVIVDWATPFSLEETFVNEQGTIKNEAEATRDVARWLHQFAELPFAVGVFKCQFIGTHANDRWFDGKARRTILQDDGTDFEYMSAGLAEAHRDVLKAVYRE